MSLISRIFLTILKPILLGVVVAGLLLIFIPEFRQGGGINLNIFDRKEVIPPRQSYYSALANSAPAVANIYSISIDNSGSIFRNRAFTRTSLGSGVIMSQDGYLLTCYHVIRNADSTYVQLQDNRVYPAQLIGFDVVTDLAVLKIDAPDLTVIPQMEATNLRVGDVVMAVGNPLDLGQTITSGIVSRTGRAGLANYFDFIQTDAELNQGNSGGALIDSNGYLVGITNASFNTIDSQQRIQTVDGVNFAVPYELAKRIMTEIIQSGTVTRGQLGVGGDDNPEGDGFIVRQVEQGGPADRAGIRQSDIILSIENTAGQSSTTATEMLDMIAETEPGAQVIVNISRNGRLFQVTATVARYSPESIAQS